MPDSGAPTIGSRGPTASAGGATASPAPVAPSGLASPLPESIGRYRIVRLLGEGGMGAVYEAEQDQPRRSVALKVIRAAWASPELLRRFEQESQALGRLHHPGIAQIYEAGSADTGFGVQPFFAMELIQGRPLVEYAEAHHLGTRQRLALMIQVCEAVQHAHHRGIIHRDLKPGNILVDESGQPKILDFGIARVTDMDAQATRQTDLGQLLGTLAYMSPEQVSADPLALDTRSDVYALGVILYELLTGKMPYELSRVLHEAVRTIQQVDPAPLSVVNRMYRGDIETIVAKALEKDKSRRYASPADLAADIRRYLEDQPITAKPASASYQLQKFTRRHKSLVAGIAAVVLVLLLGMVATTWEAVQARRQSQVAQAVDDFLQNDLLAQASAYRQAKADPDLKVRTALDRAAQNIQGKFEKQPQVEAAIRSTIGNTYSDLGLYPEAHKQLERALALDRGTLGPSNPRTLATMLSLEKTEESQGQYAGAEQLGQQLLQTSQRVLGPEHPDTLKAMNRLTSVYDDEGKDAQAEPLAEQALAISRRVQGEEASGTVSSMLYLGIIEYDLGKYAQAEALFSKTLEIRRRVLGPEHPDTLASMDNLTSAFASEGKHAQAAALDEQIVQIRQHVLGPEHPDTLSSMSNLALDYEDEGKYQQAEKLDRQTLELQRRVLGSEHPATLRSMHNLANDYRDEDNKLQAEALDNQLLEIRRRVLGQESPDTLWSMNNLALDYRDHGKFVQAEALDSQTLELRRRVLGADNPNTLLSVSGLGRDEAALGNYPQAEALYRKSLEVSPNSQVLLEGLAWFLLAAQDHHLRRPQEALEHARAAVKGKAESADNLNILGLAELRNGLWDDAIATLDKSAKLHEGADARNLFFQAMARWGRKDKGEAELLFARGVEAAKKDAPTDPELRMFWAEAAELLGKHGPVPTLLEVRADPGTAMQRLQRSAAAGQLKPETLETSPDLVPLRTRPDFQALLRTLRPTGTA
jgi:tetratricopeptide (TPR) repeat protein/predicted Ser/Thr protein kinase